MIVGDEITLLLSLSHAFANALGSVNSLEIRLVSIVFYLCLEKLGLIAAEIQISGSVNADLIGVLGCGRDKTDVAGLVAAGGVAVCVAGDGDIYLVARQGEKFIIGKVCEGA
jgi:hypothetical protein